MRLIVRRVKPAPGSQLALFATYSYHGFITGRDGEDPGTGDRPPPPRDLKYGVGLNHLPSGRFAANGARPPLTRLRPTERPANSRHPGPRAPLAVSYPAISLATATVSRHRRPQKRLQITLQPPVYPNSSPEHHACNSLTPPPLSSRRPSVSTGGFGLKLEVDVSTGSVANGSADFDRASVGEVELTP